MILGIGTDIIYWERFLHLRQKESFLKRVLTEKELFYLTKKSDERKQAAFLAKRFSGKEAFGKALGCGIGGQFDGILYTFQSIEILNNEKGAPIINILDQSFKDRIGECFISFADEKDILSCFAVITAKSR